MEQNRIEQNIESPSMWSRRRHHLQLTTSIRTIATSGCCYHCCHGYNLLYHVYCLIYYKAYGRHRSSCHADLQYDPALVCTILVNPNPACKPWALDPKSVLSGELAAAFLCAVPEVGQGPAEWGSSRGRVQGRTRV